MPDCWASRPAIPTITGYAIIAAVDSTVTPATVKISSRSDFSSRGSTAAIAIAAEAPQMAVAPPVRMPRRRDKPSSRAATMPNAIVTAIAATIMPPWYHPSAPICSTVIRAPSSATPSRRMRLAAKSTPGLATPSLATVFNAMPSSNA